MPAIDVKELSKDYLVPEKDPGLGGAVRSLFNRRWRTVRAVDQVSFQIEKGEVVGFLGANGAGKTTTLKLLSGLLTPTGGEARVMNHEPSKREPGFQRKFSLVMGQRTQLWWEIPPQETFLLNQAIYGLSDREYKNNLDELVELLDLKECLSVPVKKLSLGQRMRAELACALLHKPALLLLDEPTLGLDVVMQKKVRQFIRLYNQRHQATILLTSHNMDDVSELCPRVLIIERGRILYDGELSKLVSRYAPHKVLRIDFDKEVAVPDLSPFGRVVENGGTRAVLEVPRRDVSHRAAEILSKLPVSDLTIEEVPVDDIVRQIFSRSGPDA